MFRESVAPVACVRISDDATADIAGRHLRELGWRIVSIEDALDKPALFVGDRPETYGDPGFAGRIVLGEAGNARCDEVLALPLDLCQLTRIADAWDPRQTIGGARRLAAMFGEAAIAASLCGLRDQLANALDDADAARAHRIAGAAGTLGFPDASAAWLAVSEEQPDSLPAAFRQARRVIVAIDAAVAAGP